MALEPYFHSYLGFLRTQKNLSANTQESYRLDLMDFARFSASRQISEPKGLNRHLLRSYLGFLKENKKLSEATLARRIAAIRSWIKYMMRYHEGEVSTTELLRFGKKIKRRKSLPRALDEKDIERFLARAQSAAQMAKGRKRFLTLRDWAMYELMYSSGLRVGEIISLTISHVSADQGFLRVFGKGGRERLAPVGAQALKALRVYLYERKSFLLSRNLPESPILFLNLHGRLLSRVAVEQNLRKMAASIGLKFTPHQLRHSFATHLLTRGMDLRTLQEILGHKSLEATQVYTQLTPANLKKVYDRTHPRG